MSVLFLLLNCTGAQAVVLSILLLYSMIVVRTDKSTDLGQLLVQVSYYAESNRA